MRIKYEKAVCVLRSSVKLSLFSFIPITSDKDVFIHFLKSFICSTCFFCASVTFVSLMQKKANGLLAKKWDQKQISHLYSNYNRSQDRGIIAAVWEIEQSISPESLAHLRMEVTSFPWVVLHWDLTDAALTPTVPSLALTPHRYAVAVPALSGTWASVLYVWEKDMHNFNSWRDYFTRALSVVLLFI